MTPTRHRRPLARRAASGLATVIASVIGLGLASAPAMADNCPNAALRAENNSTQLPECRAYELVSTSFAEGFAPAAAAAIDGRLSYLSSGNFANNGNGSAGSPLGGNQYVAARSASGWSTSAPGPSGPDYLGGGQATALSSDLRSSLWSGVRRADQPLSGSGLWVRRPDDSFTRVGPASGSPKASDDLSHIVLGDGAGRTSEYVGTGHDQPRPVSVDNAGQQIAPGCGTHVGSFETWSHVISTDGRVIFWTSECAGTLYARVNGTTTINAAASQCTRAPSDPGGACNADSAAVFEGANASGTRVYFTTDQQLVNADTDSTIDLYECDIPAGTPAPVGSVNPCPDVREVSGAPSGSGFQGVTRISEDGSRVYFVTTGVLATNPGANDATAVAGDDNLYVWHRDAAHPDGQTTFVGKLAPGDPLWGGEAFLGRLAETTDDGRYLVFVSSAALIDHGPQADIDSSRDVYRYDAESGALTRLSTDADGNGGNEPGNDAQFGWIVYEAGRPFTQRPRTVVSDDGGSVVFTTTEALASDDTNGTIDVYLWHDGRVSLISSGKPSDDNLFAVGGQPSVGGFFRGVRPMIAPSGRDVYFATTARLTPDDVDTGFTIYDARVDGGFHQSSQPPCTGDACQGGRSAPPPASPPGSSSSTGQEGPVQVTPAFSVHAVTVAQRKRAASTGKVLLSVVTNAPGTLAATATIAKRAGSVGSAKRKVARAGTVSLSLTLSKKARAELKSKRKLTVKVLVSQDNVAIAQTVSLKLTQPNEAKKKALRTTSRHAATRGGRS
jgi:hypothetical protein